jgi:uncharacterized membrane protein
VTGRGPRSPLRTAAPLVLGTLFAASSVLHAVRPGLFRPLVPTWLPAADALIYASGLAEAVCAYGLLTRRPWAGRASAALLLAIWPGNIQMALDAGSGRLSGLADNPWVAWGRVPLQLPLIWAALQSRPREPEERAPDHRSVTST